MAGVRVTKEMVAGFMGSILSPTFDGATETPKFHHDLWELCCSDHTHIAIAAPRDHAKTTAVTLGYGLATLMFRERKFMLLVSDTEDQAKMFLGNIKIQLTENEQLIELFGIKKDDKGMVRFHKDSETDIIVEFTDGHRFRIIAKGAGQKLRGMNWAGSRPDLIICDDIENDESVMNPESRRKFKGWFNAALIPCVSTRGIVRIVGTILHADSLLEGFMPIPGERWTVTEDLKQYATTRKGLWYSVKYRAHSSDYKKILWPTRKTQQFFRDRYEQAVIDGLQDKYSQEYLNIPIDAATSFFQKGDFIALKEEELDKPVRVYITADLAISQSERADYSVFVVAAVDETKRIQIRNVIRERLDGREIVDTILRLQRTYEPEFIGIEEMQVSKALGPFLREEMIKHNVYANIIPLKTMNKDKIMRSRSIQARMRARSVRFLKTQDWYAPFEQECIEFPRGKHDDQVDAFSYIGLLLDKVIEAPTEEEIEDDEYETEMRSSGYGDSGRSDITGY